MANIILPDDPDFSKPLVMGDAYEKALTPKMASTRRAEDFDREREKEGTKFKYATTMTSPASEHWYQQMMKISQMQGVDNMMTQPMWFSPLHTPQNWQVASKRREVYQWCHHPDTEILMGNGTLKPINQVKNGDYVITHTGKKRQVKCIGKRLIDENVYTIYYSGISKPLITTGNHKLFSASRSNIEETAEVMSSRRGHLGLHRYKEHISQNIEWTKAESLEESDLLFTPQIQRTTRIVNSSIEWTEGICELLGIYAAEGDICWYKYKGTKRPKGIRLTISDQEVVFLETIRTLVKNEFDKEIKIYKQKGSLSIHVYNREIGEFCLQHVGHGACTKQLSSQLKSLPDQYIKSFLKGYISGDGSISKEDGKIILVTASKCLAEDTIYLAMSLGIPFRYRAAVTSSKFSDKVHHTIIFPKTIAKLGIYKFSSINEKDLDNVYTKLPNRIYKSWFDVDVNGQKNTSRRISKIDITPYKGYVYNIEVEEDHSYVANYISVANCRFWYENEPKVAAAIDFYSRFPMNGFKLECPDRKVLAFFEHHVAKKLKLNERLKEISSEYFMLGDVFIHTDVDCDICHGSNEEPDTGEVCDHPGGKFRRIFVMNPDWIEVQKSPLTDESLIVLIPDEELQQIVHKRQPKAIYDRLPDRIKKLIMSRAPIPLSGRTTSHLKHMPVPYGTYGTSISRRLFTTLAYKTKIMTANWIVAERLIVPVRVVKIGSDDRPATSTDIADIQQQMAAVANDPNMTIVTHHNFEYDWYGVTGKVLQITQEMEHIDKELLDGLMLNQALLNGEMCHDEETEVLTDSGFKKIENVYTNDKIACYDVYTNKNNVYTDRIIYEHPLEKHEYDHDGDMIHFSGEQLDIMVTPNHKMLVKSQNKNEREVILAENVKPGMRFLAHSEYEPNHEIEEETYIDETISVNSEKYFEYAGYYLSEGHMSCQKGNYQISISQSKKSPVLQTMTVCMTGMGLKYSEYDYDNRDTNSLTICNKKFVKHMKDAFGSHADNKSIPSWMKNAPVSYLSILLKSLVDGDGCTTVHKNTKNHVYTTISENLADDVQEIAFKCGYNVRKAIHVDRSKDINSKSRLLYRVKFSKGKWSKGNEPRLKKHHINKVPYKGKVWCFSTSTGYFVTRRNGKIAIQGNSGYQSAQVGVETLIRRIESWRHTLADWCEERIFKPIAEMQGFVDEKKSAEVGETCFLYPTIKWNELGLKDKTQFHTLLVQLHDKQVISTQTLLEELGLNYDQEVKRMRYEQVSAGPGGMMMGAGAMGGGMGMGAGMPGGAASPAQGMGAGMPGSEMAPMGGPGGAMGGGVGTGGAPGGGAPAMAGVGGKISKKGKAGKEEEAEPMQIMPIKLTQIEQKMAGMMENVANVMGFGIENIRMQFPVDNPKGGKPYTMDFAIPGLKIDCEADGDAWHSSQEQVGGDKERDYTLAQRGWTVLRFDEQSIEDAPQAVEATITSYVQKALEAGKSKTAATDNGKSHTVPSYFTSINGELKNLKGNADKYYKGVKKVTLESAMIGERSKEEYFAEATKI